MWRVFTYLTMPLFNNQYLPAWPHLPQCNILDIGKNQYQTPILPIHNCKFWVLPIWRRLKIARFKNHGQKTIGFAIQRYFEISGLKWLKASLIEATCKKIFAPTWDHIKMLQELKGEESHIRMWSRRGFMWEQTTQTTMNQ